MTEEKANSKKVSLKKDPSKPATKTKPAAIASEKPIAKLAKIKKVKKVKEKKYLGTKVSDLPATVFDSKVNKQVLFDTILSERANKRQGTHQVKNRGEVRGGGRKPFAQKGTGRARAGSTRSPIWVGGGVVFGPQSNRNYSLKVNKKVRKLALTSALTLKAMDGSIIATNVELTKVSTKGLIEFLTKLKVVDFKTLLVTENENVFKSAKNLQSVKTTKVNSLSIEAIVNAEVVLISKKDISTLEGLV